MTTKNLSRTAIEGGRRRRSKYARWQSNGDHRAAERSFLDRVRVDPETAEYVSPAPRQPERPSFYDKLAPAHRWLAHQTGRRWDAVYADLIARFDTRTIAGRHIVFDHLLAWVWRGDADPRDLHTRCFHFVVDEHGILRTARWFRRRFSGVTAEAERWCGDRYLGRWEARWWWFAIVRDHPPCTLRWQCGRRHDRRGRHVDTPPPVIRRLRLLDRGELRYFEQLPPWVQDSLQLEPARSYILFC